MKRAHFDKRCALTQASGSVRAPSPAARLRGPAPSSGRVGPHGRFPFGGPVWRRHGSSRHHRLASSADDRNLRGPLPRRRGRASGSPTWIHRHVALLAARARRARGPLRRARAHPDRPRRRSSPAFGPGPLPGRGRRQRRVPARRPRRRDRTPGGQLNGRRAGARAGQARTRAKHRRALPRCGMAPRRP